MKGPFRLQIMIAFIVTLSFLVGQTPSQVFAGEIVVQGTSRRSMTLKRVRIGWSRLTTKRCMTQKSNVMS
jgi:hypothetical protein